MASATTKRSPGTAEPKKELFQRATAIEWTDEDQRAVIAAGRKIQEKEHLHVRALLDRAMREALPESKWRTPTKWPADRLMWFINGLKEERTKVETTRSPRIEWTPEEKAELIVEGRAIRSRQPNLGPRIVLERAQRAVLSEDRQRQHIHSIPPDRMKWYVDALAGDLTEAAREDELVELPPVELHSELTELPPVELRRPAPLGKTKSKGSTKSWDPYDLEKILARAREIRDETGLMDGRRLIVRAQQDVLPSEKRVGKIMSNAATIQYLLDRMSAWPPLRVEVPEPTPATEPPVDPRVAESLRLAAVDYAYPPPAPEPIDVDAVVTEAVEAAVADTLSAAIIKAGTEDMLAEMARRAYVAFTDWMTVVSGGFSSLQSLQVAQNKDHDLLLRLAQEWDPKLLAEPPAPAPSPVTANGSSGTSEALPPVAAPAKLTPPRIRGVLVGGAVEFGREVVNAVKTVIDLEHNPSSNNARNKGFKNYDVCFVTPIAGHSATKVAKNELGHENVLFIPHTSVTRIAEEIRKFVSKRESRWMRAQQVRSN